MEENDEEFNPKGETVVDGERCCVVKLVWKMKLGNEVGPIYILEMYRNNKFWWKKDPLVIPCGLAWSKIGNFKKGDYGAIFAEWSNPILCMAPTSTELLQPWLIRSMDYFRTLLVDGQPNGPITASPQGIQPIICAAIVHDLQFEQQPKQVVESVLVFTSEELVAEYHSITTSVQLIENVGDVSCDKYVGGFYECESSKLYYTDPKEYPYSSMPQLLQATVLEQTSSQMVSYTLMDSNLPNLNESFTESQVKFDNPENDSLSDMVKTGEEEIHLDELETVDDPFVQTPDKQNSEYLDAWFELMLSFRPTNTDWAIASSYFCRFVMRGDIPGWVCNGVRYLVMWADMEQIFFFINEPKKHYCLGVLHIRTSVITLYDSLFSKAVKTRKWWIKMRKAFKKYIPPYLQE
ncbi:phospholipase-like protein [Tanacetum coccineum]